MTSTTTTTLDRFFVLADGRQVGHYRLWDRWTMRPLGAPAHTSLAAAEYEARRMNGARR